MAAKPVIKKLSVAETVEHNAKAAEALASNQAVINTRLFNRLDSMGDRFDTAAEMGKQTLEALKLLSSQVVAINADRAENFSNVERLEKANQVAAKQSAADLERREQGRELQFKDRANKAAEKVATEVATSNQSRETVSPRMLHQFWSPESQFDGANEMLRDANFTTEMLGGADVSMVLTPQELEDFERRVIEAKQNSYEEWAALQKGQLPRQQAGQARVGSQTPSKAPPVRADVMPKLVDLSRDSSPNPSRSNSPNPRAVRRTAAEAFEQGQANFKLYIERETKQEHSESLPIFQQLEQGDCSDYTKGRLCRKALHASQVQLYLQSQNSSEEGVVRIAEKPRIKMKYILNPYLLQRLMSEILQYQSKKQNEPLCPADFMSDVLKAGVLQRCRDIMCRGDILADYGIPTFVVPSAEQYDKLLVKEWYTPTFLACIPQSTEEFSDIMESAYASQALHYGFSEGEYTVDLDKIDQLCIAKCMLAVEMGSELLPQWSRVRNVDGSLKECVTFPGTKDNRETGEGNWKTSFFKGPCFGPPEQPRIPGVEAGHPRQTFKRSTLQMGKKSFIATQMDKIRGNDVMYELGRFHQSWRWWHKLRRKIRIFDSAFAGGVTNPTPMLHQQMFFNPKMPGQLSLAPAVTKPPAIHSPVLWQQQPSRSSYQQAGSSKKDPEAWRQELLARGSGEIATPPYYKQQQLRRSQQPSQKPVLQFMEAISILENQDDQTDSEVMQTLHQHAQLLQDNYERECMAYDQQGQSDEHDFGADSYSKGGPSQQGRGEPWSEPSARPGPREYKDEALDEVMGALSNITVGEAATLPASVRDRLNTWQSDRNNQRSGNEHRHDGAQWQDRRNSSTNNPGKVTEYPAKKVAFANTSPYGGACQMHLAEVCPFADNPSRCRWSHDPVVCSAAADKVTAIEQRRKAAIAAEKAGRKPGTRASAVAAMGTDYNRQQMEQQQSSGTQRRSSSSDDEPREE